MEIIAQNPDSKEVRPKIGMADLRRADKVLEIISQHDGAALITFEPGKLTVIMQLAPDLPR